MERDSSPLHPFGKAATMESTHAHDAEQPYHTNGEAMSWRARAWVEQLTGLTWAQRGVLDKLAMHASNDGGNAWPSVATIAAQGSAGERSVRRILTQLIERKLIEVDGYNGRVGGRHTTTYRILIAEGFNLKTRAAKCDSDADQGGHLEQGGRPNATGRAANLAAEPVQEPVKEENYQSLRSWRPDSRLDRQALRKIIWSEGVDLVMELTDRRHHQARGLIGKIIKGAGPEQVIEALQDAADLRPADAAAYLMRVCGERLSSEDRIARDWGLTSLGYDSSREEEVDKEASPPEQREWPGDVAELVH